MFVQKFKFILMKMHKTVATRAAPFGLDMHQIVCRLGLRPRPHWRSLQRSPRLPSWCRGWGPEKREGGREGKRRERSGGKGKGGEGVPECPNPELASLLSVSYRSYIWRVTKFYMNE